MKTQTITLKPLTEVINLKINPIDNMDVTIETLTQRQPSRTLDVLDQDLIFLRAEKYSSLCVENCTIKTSTLFSNSTLVFKNSTLEQVDIIGTSISVIFDNCIFTGTVNQYGSGYRNVIDFKGNSTTIIKHK